MTNILIVENDATLANTLKTQLESKQFFCVVVDSVQQALTEVEEFVYDIVILDRILNDGDGIEVAQFIADYAYKTKIIILSELTSITERINGLENGADDYLTKPFSVSELLLKINKLQHTEKIKAQETLKLGKIEISPDSGEISLNGKNKVLRKKEAQLLTCLIRHKNQVVSRKRIIDTVWSNTYNLPTESTLDVYVRRIRINLGKYKSYIKTVRGFGYMATE